MPLLLVLYDLNRPGQNYDPLWQKLKSYGAWWHELDSTWLVKTRLTPHELHDQLVPYLDANDELLIVDVTGKAWWSRGLNPTALQWLHDNFAGT
jgi:hypothetical protein